MPLTRDEDISALLTSARTVAMVGASNRPNRPSYGVMRILQDHGYRVLPVNPQIAGEHVHGEVMWRGLSQIGIPIDIVDIFRRPEAAGRRSIRRLPPAPKQSGCRSGSSEEAAARAEAAGLRVMMDRCPAIELRRLGIKRREETET